MDIRFHAKESLEGALLVIGFPSRGLVGGVAANYVIDSLKMWHVASLYDPRLPPTVIIRRGAAHSPVEFFVSAERCGPDGNCDKLVVGLAEVPIPEKLLGEVAWATVKWAKDEGVKHIVVLEGTSPLGAGLNGPKKQGTVIRGVHSIKSQLDLAKYGVERAPDSVLSSYSSAFLLAANAADADLSALFVESKKDLADAHSASILLEAVDAMLPHIDLNAKTLDRRAGRLEKEMRKSIDQNREQLATLRRSDEFMYQ